MAITQQKRNCVFCCWFYYRSNIDMKKDPVRKIRFTSQADIYSRTKQADRLKKIRKNFKKKKGLK